MAARPVDLDLGSEARELARALEARRLAVSTAGTVFVYCSSRPRGRASATCHRGSAPRRRVAGEAVTEHWLADGTAGTTVPARRGGGSPQRGYAPWEVRVECDSVAAASRASRSGWNARATVSFAPSATSSRARRREEARELARRVHGQAEPEANIVWEVALAIRRLRRPRLEKVGYASGDARRRRIVAAFFNGTQHLVRTCCRNAKDD